MDALGNIGDFLGGIGVVITLVYLAGQIRQNTRSVRISAFQAAQRGEMDDGIGRMDLEGPTDRDRVGYIDFAIRAVGVVADSAKFSHEPSSHESGRAGDKDPHGRRLPDCGSNSNALRPLDRDPRDRGTWPNDYRSRRS